MTAKKVLIFIVAYNAESKIVSVLERIPKQLGEDWQVELLLIDDCSKDATAQTAKNHLDSVPFPYPACVLRNPVNLGYGGNQKVGYRYAVTKGFDVVLMLHGDGQYAPEKIPDMLAPFAGDSAVAAVLGSRMLGGYGALKGGMPLYKFAGNKVLTWMQNRLLGTHLSEFHTGYRAYATSALARVPFEINTDDFHFDTEIIVQLVFAHMKIVEIPIPTFYGDEVCHVDGMKYAGDVMRASVKARLMSFGIFFDPKFDVAADEVPTYVSKLDFRSTHAVAYAAVPESARVVDMGCADGYLSRALHSAKGCNVTATDLAEEKSVDGCEYQRCDLNDALPRVAWDDVDYAVMLDVIEHLASPETFLRRLRTALSANRKIRLIISSGNVCFFVTRIMMLLGKFNYGKRGILDITHTRLFTVKSLARLLRYGGFAIEKIEYVPAPYPLAIGLNAASRFMLATNQLCARILPGLFAYQTLLIVRPKPTTDYLLQSALASDRGYRGVSE
ncbi:MAG: glycosyltransferase [Rudaea sp.]|uniref:glycosyltransferase n=1 Tax=Rudaea sp. TaxID=2136325 RepID=UPI0039E44575